MVNMRECVLVLWATIRFKLVFNGLDVGLRLWSTRIRKQAGDGTIGYGGGHALHDIPSGPSLQLSYKLGKSFTMGDNVFPRIMRL